MEGGKLKKGDGGVGGGGGMRIDEIDISFGCAFHMKSMSKKGGWDGWDVLEDRPIHTLWRRSTLSPNTIPYKWQYLHPAKCRTRHNKQVIWSFC